MSEMEYWSWPPQYDDTYRPEAGSRDWFPRRETTPAGERARGHVARLGRGGGFALGKAPVCPGQRDEARLPPEPISSPGGLAGQVLGRARRLRTPRLQGVPLRSGRARHVLARSAMDEHHEAAGVLRHTFLRPVPRGGGPEGRRRREELRDQAAVLLRRAGGLGSRRQGSHRAGV